MPTRAAGWIAPPAGAERPNAVLALATACLGHDDMRAEALFGGDQPTSMTCGRPGSGSRPPRRAWPARRGRRGAGRGAVPACAGGRDGAAGAAVTRGPASPGGAACGRMERLEVQAAVTGRVQAISTARPARPSPPGGWEHGAGSRCSVGRRRCSGQPDPNRRRSPRVGCVEASRMAACAAGPGIPGDPDGIAELTVRPAT